MKLFHALLIDYYHNYHSTALAWETHRPAVDIRSSYSAALHRRHLIEHAIHVNPFKSSQNFKIKKKNFKIKFFFIKIFFD